MKFLMLAGLASILLGIAEQVEAAPFRQETTYTLPSGKRVGIVFRERPCKRNGCREAISGVWGTDGGIPRFIADVFRVSIDGREFLIPEKFYRDLANTRSLDVFEQNGQIALELKGGQAAGAYTARFLLGGMCGFERKVCGEVCKEIWEQTIWYNSFAYEADPQCKSGIQ
ncbi:hypothetical protein [Nitrosovibrio tenuis]|uniref:Uncharacterized protein n=1 Tax=Nitrosovibrio tenuis TaxID=1233 RepID=A0A1H7MJK2_9PROT|nr:hypothetical protein [Nitrosovibrio tenuis]SEL11372.1 hypothetical protein SAMN05216387_105110 [Nitrosovibrio tenuis]